MHLPRVVVFLDKGEFPLVFLTNVTMHIFRKQSICGGDCKSLKSLGSLHIYDGYVISVHVSSVKYLEPTSLAPVCVISASEKSTSSITGVKTCWINFVFLVRCVWNERLYKSGSIFLFSEPVKLGWNSITILLRNWSSSSFPLSSPGRFYATPDNFTRQGKCTLWSWSTQPKVWNSFFFSWPLKTP